MVDSIGPGGRRGWRILSLGLVAACLAPAGIVSGCGSADSDDGDLNGMTRNPPADVGGMALPDESPGRSGRETAFRGDGDGLMLVYFGYTSCPDVCPTTLADLKTALGGLDRDEAERVSVGMVTVDPKRDTPRILNGYLGHFVPAGRFAAFRTTDPADLDRVERAFGASSELGEPDRNGDYDVSHSAQVYAVDRTGTVLVEWPFGTPPDAIRSDLDRLLNDGASGEA